MTALRYAEKIVSLDGGTTILLPTDLYEYQDSGALRSARSQLHGTSYAYDHLRNAVNLREVARSSVRFGIGEATAALGDAYIDSLRSTLLAMGPFWLYTLGADGTRRKARCRLAQMPDLLISYKRSVTALASLDMDRYSDWLAEAQTITTQVITATPTTWVVTNPGLFLADEIEIRLRSNGLTGFTNPLLENLTNGYKFQSARDAVSANSELKLNTADPSVRYSDDDGATYADDFAQLTLPATQVPLSFLLDPGGNSIRYTNTGVPDVNITFTFFAKWG